MPDWLFFLDKIEQLCNPYCLQWWQTVGIWLTGFATLSAVLVSLALARREGPKIRVSAGIRLVVQPGSGGPADRKLPEFVGISIRNVGGRPVKIEGVGWHPAPWRKEHGYQMIPPQASGVTLPHWVPDGDSLNLYISIDGDDHNWMADFARKFIGRWPALEVRLLRVVAWTPAGHTFRGPIDESIKRRLLAAVRKSAVSDPERDE